MKDKIYEDLKRYLPARPREDTEAFKIIKEVESRKEKAKERGVDSLVKVLFFDYLKDWFRCDSNCWETYYKNNFPNTEKIIGKANQKLIAEDQPIDNKSEKHSSISFTINRKEYMLSFKKRSYYYPEYWVSGLLELYLEKRKLLALNLSCDSDLEWRCFDITAFIEGDWINDFENLKVAIIKDNQESAWRKAEDLSKINELKKSFGIN